MHGTVSKIKMHEEQTNKQMNEHPHAQWYLKLIYSRRSYELLGLHDIKWPYKMLQVS